MRGVGTKGIAGFGMGLTALAVAGPAQAADFTVSSTADTATAGTLRTALQQARDNNNPGTTDRILFQSGLTGTVTLGSNLPQIDEPISIQGPGAAAVTVSGNDTFRIFDAYLTTRGPVFVSGLTLTKGLSDAQGTDPNQFPDPLGGGPAISADSADVVVRDAVITDNQVLGSFANGFNGGGGIELRNGSLLVERSTISDNRVESTSTGGGGINAGSSDVTIRQSTISGNATTETNSGGAGIRAAYGDISIENSTITGNTTSGADSAGGGVYFSQGTLSVEGSTITANGSIASGGGIQANTPSAPTVISSSIVAENTAVTDGDDIESFGIDTDLAIRFSLYGDDDFDGLDQPIVVSDPVPGSNLVNQPPMLGALADNGGPTPTRAPAPASPVVDKGSTTLPNDQRNKVREFDFAGVTPSMATGADNSDIGAVELGSTVDYVPPDPEPIDVVVTPNPPATTPSPQITPPCPPGKKLVKVKGKGKKPKRKCAAPKPKRKKKP